MHSTNNKNNRIEDKQRNKCTSDKFVLPIMNPLQNICAAYFCDGYSEKQPRVCLYYITDNVTLCVLC